MEEKYDWNKIADFEQLMKETIDAAKHCLQYTINGYFNITSNGKKVLSDKEVEGLAEHLYKCEYCSHGHGCYKHELEDLRVILLFMNEEITLNELSAIMQRYDKITHREVFSRKYYGGDRENLRKAVEYVIKRRKKNEK